MMDVKVYKDGWIERTLSISDEIESETMHKDKQYDRERKKN